MAKKGETRLQQRIQKALKKEWPKSWWFKVWGGPFQVAGVPDLVGCVEGLFCALEVKMPKGKVSEIQFRTIQKINTAGGLAGVVTTPEEAVACIRLSLVATGRLSKKGGRLRAEDKDPGSLHGTGNGEDVDNGWRAREALERIDELRSNFSSAVDEYRQYVAKVSERKVATGKRRKVAR